MNNDPRNSALRKLPSLQKLLVSPAGEKLSARFGRGITAALMRLAIVELRQSLETGQQFSDLDGEILTRAEGELQLLFEPNGRTVINATGIVLHTGLGRAPLSDAAVQALTQSGHYTLVEVDRITGERSRRERRAEQLLKQLTDCEAATVVNNCAAAIFLALASLPQKGEVIVSRGHLVEIGGSYRMPDVMAASGCTLHEVGTTNRTSLKDYEGAINERTTAILFVSQSNFRIRGFTEIPPIEAVCEAAKRRSVPVLYDLGGGSLLGLERWGFPHETTVQEAIKAGCSLVCFSGDKLIGGAQAGILCGEKRAVEIARANPFFRMFRPDKLCLAALELSLAAFLNERAEQEIPVYRMISASSEELRARAQEIAQLLAKRKELDCTVIDDAAYLGGGALPDEALPTPAIRLSRRDGDERTRSRYANSFAKLLRNSRPAVFARVESGSIILNFRTIAPEQTPALTAAILEAAARL